MTLDELIAKLQEIREEGGGELRVAVEYWGGWNDGTVRRVYMGRPEPGDPETVVVSAEEE